ncbi:glycoside hydrolase family 38 C-terminal domain-containing protein [Synechococcus sp. PCC 7336]|uniref:alpha-mannosidase n=1 Tax=Synechococcus sp. PCC 7336 TaxID=195250 RepID=UPI00056F97C2|nr:glycoside hydrolase family 38 C-terminal domain-containing protein [Synechococcus sp. PCC 7336]
MDRSLGKAIACLRQQAVLDLMAGWQASPAGDTRTWLEPERRIWMWPRGQQRQIFRQTWQVPDRLGVLPLEGATLRLKLLWWAAAAEIWVNGDRVCAGDLFDRDCRLPLSVAAIAGERFELELRLESPGHDDGALMVSQIVAEYPQRVCDPGRLADELAVLQSCRPLLDSGEDETAWDGQAWGDRLLEVFERPIDDRIWEQLGQLRGELLPFGRQLKQRRVYLLGNAHIDVAWLWPIAETQAVVQRTFESVLNLQRQFPKMTFNQSTALSYGWIERHYPALFETVRQAVQQGWWELTGGMWVEPDCNLPCGEALVRQVLYGQRYFRERFDRQVKVAWNPDSFGFCGQLPQILAKSGFEVFITQKLTWNDTNSFPHQLFWWEGLDGSRILTYFCNELGQGIEPEAIAQSVVQWERDCGTRESLWLYGVGDHGGGPTADMLNVASSWGQDDLFFSLEPATAEAFFDRLKPNLDQLELAVWRDELYLEFHRGTYTSKADRKRQNRQLEVWLTNVEKLRAIAAIEANIPYPQQDLQAAWQTFLTNQFHDILPGSAIPEAFADADRADGEVRRVCREAIAALADGNGDRDRFSVWNLLNWERRELVELSDTDWNLENVSGVLEIETSQVLPIQVTDSGLMFPARVASMGAAQFQLLRGAIAALPEVDSPLEVAGDRLENRYVRVQIDLKTGEIGQIVDKRSGRALLSGNAELQVFDDRGQYWDAWNIDPEYEAKRLEGLKLVAIEVVESGPLRASVRVVWQFRRSRLQQEIQLEADAAFVTVCNQWDWQESHLLLKANFPLAFSAPLATYEIPFGAIERSTLGETSQERAKWEVPALRWANLSGDGMGLAVLNDCKYGYDAKPNGLRLTLLRSPTWPDPNSDLGRHEFVYRLVPHAGNWRAAGIVRQGWHLNNALYPLPQGSISGDRPLIEIDSEAIVLAAWKRAEDGAGWIVRLYESCGESVTTEVQVSQAIGSLQVCDLLENAMSELPARGDRFAVTFKPFEIQTYRLQLQA